LFLTILNVVSVLLQVLVVFIFIVDEIYFPSKTSNRIFNMILGCLLFIIPFLVIFFSEGRIKKIISLIVIILLNIFIPVNGALSSLVFLEMLFGFGASICSITSCVLALILRW